MKDIISITQILDLQKIAYFLASNLKKKNPSKRSAN